MIGEAIIAQTEKSAAFLMEKAEKESHRRCIATESLAEKHRMIRFVLDEDNVVTPDIKGRLPGRGLWVLAENAALHKAIAGNVFAKAARAKAIVPSDLFARTLSLIEQEALDLLGLAKRSGMLVAGFEKVEAVLRQDKVRFLVEAKDGAKIGREKLVHLARPSVEIKTPFPAIRLAQALGRDHVIHIAILHSGIADRLGHALLRLEALAEKKD